VLGGFTTASTLALDVRALADRPAVALGHLGLSLAAGVLAAAAGLRLGRRR
jgi:fluoride ion exporter CrcB/FEX